MIEPQKKRMSSVVIGLVILVVILSASTGYLYYQYDQYQNYVSTHSYADTELSSLISNYDSYRSSHSHTNAEYNSLLSQIQTLTNERNQLQIWLDGNETFIEQFINLYTQTPNFEISNILRPFASLIFDVYNFGAKATLVRIEVHRGLGSMDVLIVDYIDTGEGYRVTVTGGSIPDPVKVTISCAEGITEEFNI
jgi:hypothetical protein